MPEIGDIRVAREIGRKGGHKYIWMACISCGKERWTALVKGKPVHQACVHCHHQRTPKGETHYRWSGGRFPTKAGYIKLHITEDSFFWPMAQKRTKTCFEHRIVMAQHLGRCLMPFEQVHHKNGAKDDNRIENLELCGTASEHSTAHSKGYRDGYQKGLYDGHEKRIKTLEARVTALEAENALLRVTSIV